VVEYLRVFCHVGFFIKEIATMTTPAKTRKKRHKKTAAADCPSGTVVSGQTQRRRLIDPTTCVRAYTDDDIQFMKAMDQYKLENRRQFPTWSEVLEVLNALGYRKVADPTPMPGMPIVKESFNP